MMKDLTIRPKGDRTIREAPTYPFDGDMNNPLSGIKVKELLSVSSDVVFRDFFIQGKERIPCQLVAVDGMVDKNQLDMFVLKPLMVDLVGHPDMGQLTLANVVDRSLQSLLPGLEFKKINKIGQAIEAIFWAMRLFYSAILPRLWSLEPEVGISVP